MTLLPEIVIAHCLHLVFLLLSEQVPVLVLDGLSESPGLMLHCESHAPHICESRSHH